MKKQLLTLISCLFTIASFGQADWICGEKSDMLVDFSAGTGNGQTTFTGTSASSITTYNSTSPGFLPKPPTGTVRVVSGSSTSPGIFTLIGNSLKINASSTNSAAKFNWYGLSGGSALSLISFTVNFTNASSTADWICLVGSQGTSTTIFDGSSSNISVSNTSTASNPEIFAVLKWNVLSSNTSKMECAYRVKPNATATIGMNTVSTTFDRGVNYKIQLLCNNTPITQKYTVNGVTYSVGSRKYHMWANTVQVPVSTNVYDFPANELAVNEDVNAFGIFGANSKTGTTANNSATATISTVAMQLVPIPNEGLKPFINTLVDCHVITRNAVTGKLVYQNTTTKNDKIPDYSHAGYKNNTAAIPTATVKTTVNAPATGSTADQCTIIQNAINYVSGLSPDANGIRGAVLLKKGTYYVSGNISIPTSGVVLRGEGQNDDGTIIIDTSPVDGHSVVTITGTGGRTEIANTRSRVSATTYVPVGSTTVTVANGSLYQVGNRIALHTQKNQAWVDVLKMGQSGGILGSGDTYWIPTDYDDFHNEKTIMAISGNQITFDVPIMDALDPLYDVTEMYKISTANRIKNAGVENLQIKCTYNTSLNATYTFPGGTVTSPSDLNHAGTGVAVNNAEDCWVKNVTTKHMSVYAVNVSGGSARITVDGCKYLEGVSPLEGGYRYAFNSNAQQVLFRNCYASTARHDFVVGARVPGPVAFVNCSSENSLNVSENHQRWGYGILFDNVSVKGVNTFLSAGNRGTSGTGHGWSGANVTFWNCSSVLIVAMKPATAQNYVIGIKGAFFDANSLAVRQENLEWFSEMAKKTFVDYGTVAWGDAYVEAPQNPVRVGTVTSLFDLQLQERANGGFQSSVQDKSMLLDELPESKAFQLYPNPVVNELFVAYNSDYKQKTQVAVVNMQGITLLKKEVDMIEGANQFSLQLSHIPSGVYLMKISGNKISENKLFVK
jgi:hypothetical protein